MASEGITIRRFDARTVPEKEIPALHAFNKVLVAERCPDDPPPTFEDAVRDHRAPTPGEERTHWAAWDLGTGEVVGTARIWVSLDHEHRHLAGFHLEVRPDRRRRGLGTRLLAGIVEVARANRRTALTAWTYTPAGEPFMQRIGAQVGNLEWVSQLDLTDLDRALLDTWIARAKERASGFQLEFWPDGYPEEDLEQAAAVQHAMNSAPRGDLPQRDMVFTPALLRERLEALRALGVTLWTMVARDTATGCLAGFTEIRASAAHPERVEQGDTGVLAEYRNRGVGRWLKAAMLQELLRRRPDARRIRTDNAETNAAMLKINVELGYRPHSSITGWHTTPEQLEEYLRRSDERR